MAFKHLLAPIVCVVALSACDANRKNEGSPRTIVVDGVTYDGLALDNEIAVRHGYSAYRFWAEGETIRCGTLAECKKLIRRVVEAAKIERELKAGTFRADTNVSYEEDAQSRGD